MKFLKCSEPSCHTHQVFVRTQRLDGSFLPAPEGWLCAWHRDPHTGLEDHRAAVAWSNARTASVARS